MVRGFEEDTLKGYVRQLQRLARIERMSPGARARGLLEERLLQVARVEHSDSVVK